LTAPIEIFFAPRVPNPKTIRPALESRPYRSIIS
jgi:hypothetical protein